MAQEFSEITAYLPNLAIIPKASKVAGMIWIWEVYDSR